MHRVGASLCAALRGGGIGRAAAAPLLRRTLAIQVVQSTPKSITKTSSTRETSTSPSSPSSPAPPPPRPPQPSPPPAGAAAASSSASSSSAFSAPSGASGAAASPPSSAPRGTASPWIQPQQRHATSSPPPAPDAAAGRSGDGGSRRGVAALNAQTVPLVYDGIASQPFDENIKSTLLAPIETSDVEIKPDGTLYLPEIKYRRILNIAIGPGGWAMKPVSPVKIEDNVLSRTYQLWALGRFVAEAVGEQQLHRNAMTVPTAEESAKSNALMRCCKDLGIASELWDPIYIARWKREHAVCVWATHQRSGEKRKLWRNKLAAKFSFPFQETGIVQD